MQAILVAENEEDREFLSFSLRQMGLSVKRHAKITAVIKLLAEHPVDLLVIVQESPAAIEDIQAVRFYSQMPLLLLVEQITEAQHCDLLDVGVDLILKRPLSPRILKRYIRAFLRRAGSIPVSVLSSVQAGNVLLDPETRTVQVQDMPPQRLTLLEFRLLYIFITNPNHVIPINIIIERVWGYDGEGNRELVRGLVRRLRRKIEPIPKEPQYIHNLPGIGYQFIAPSEAEI